MNRECIVGSHDLESQVTQFWLIYLARILVLLNCLLKHAGDFRVFLHPKFPVFFLHDIDGYILSPFLEWNI